MAENSYPSDAPVNDEQAESQPKDQDQKVLDQAKKRIQHCAEATKDNRDKALDDLKFLTSEQWPSEIRAKREIDGRPCLVINKLPQSVRQVTNDQRQNRPSIKIHPVDDKGDIETAKVFQGMVRHIEVSSNADAAYDTGFEQAASGGFGYWRVITQYESALSFNQEILIKRIPNQFSVFFDPHSMEPDGSDANWAAVSDDMSREDFCAQFPESELAKTQASSAGFETTGNHSPGWIEKDSCRVVEYFYKEYEERDIYLLSSGEVVFKEKLEQIFKTKALQGENVQVQAERKAMVPTIYWCKLNAIELLEKTVWPGRYIPIVPVYGQEYIVDGKRILEGIVRNAKDPARMYNYMASAEAEAIALAPRAPWIMAEGQDEGYERDWETANTRNHSVLKYKAVALNGQPVGPPQRNAFEPAVQAITQARMLASDDLKSTTGIYDAALGAKSNETSGVAIQRRNVQAQTSNYHFNDNLTRSQKHTGRILVDLIPKIYDTQRAVRIIGEEGDEKIIQLYTEIEEKGKKRVYDLSIGKYDVSVAVGPSFATKRQEAVTAMMEVTRAVPQMMQLAGDLMVKNMDWPGAQEIAERLKKALPPGLADDPENKQPIPPQVQAQMQQMSQMVEQLTGKLQELQTEKEQKLIEIESRERIEMAKLETSATIELAKLESKEAVTLLQSEIQTAKTQLQNQIAELDQRTQVLRFDQPFEHESQEQPQVSPMPEQAGAEEPPMAGADAGMEQDPTGGASPGLPIEGMNPDVQ